jgi:hypothetical protein
VKKLPIDLKLRTVTTRVSVAAWDRAQSLKKELGCSLQDVLSAALLYIELATLKRVMQSQRPPSKNCRRRSKLSSRISTSSRPPTAKRSAPSSKNKFSAHSFCA